MRDLSRSDRTHRLIGYTFLAWGVMVAMLAAWFAHEFYTGRVGDPEIRDVGEALLIPFFFLSIPYGVAAFAILLPTVFGLQALTKGRLPRWGNILLAALISLPAAELCWIVASMVFGRDRSVAEMGRIVMRSIHTFQTSNFNPRGSIFPIALVAGLLIISAGAQRKGERLV